MAIETIAGRYELVRRLGAGGMGDVWLAWDLLLGRHVAMKFVGERELRETPGANEILRDEAKTAGSLLGNPQIVSVLDLLDVEIDLHRGPALIMEYLEGGNLAEWMSGHSPRVADEVTRQQMNLYIALEVTDAIHTAHKMGILHRDIKPQNILCSRQGRIKVTDFGLARVVEAITRTHTVWGRHTPLYAAPEQWEDEKPDEGTDIYQLCATLYHLFAGQPANRGSSVIGLLRWHQAGALIPLGDLTPGLSSAVTEVITAGLSKDTDERPALWQIFDALSDAIMTRVELFIDVTSCEKDSIDKIVMLTDFNSEKLRSGSHGSRFPNSLEALREAVGATVLGATCQVTDVSA
jgi:serine/threonine protein kinase